MKERRFSCAATQKIKLGRRETFPDIARRVPKHELRRLMTITQLQGAKVIGISPTTLKKLCCHYGIPRWPFRKIAGADRAKDGLAAMLVEPPVQQQPQQSTAKPVSRVGGHYQVHTAVGGAMVSRATSTHEPSGHGVTTNNVLSMGAARGAAFVNHQLPSSITPLSSPPFPPGSGSSSLCLLKPSESESGGGGRTSGSVGYTTYADLATRSLNTPPSFC